MQCANAIWMERNKRIFEKRVTRWKSITWEIVYVCNIRASDGIRKLVQSFIYSVKFSFPVLEVVEL